MNDASPMPIRAAFNPLTRPYLGITIGFTLVMTFVLIPLAILWFLGVGQWWARHYFDKLECELSDRALRYRKGILFQIEKTIPPENIQDVTFIEGPLLKRFNLSTLRFETAGQSAAKDGDLRLTGIIDAHDFRNRILQARDALRHPAANERADAGAVKAHDEQVAILRAIQERLDEIAALLRRKPWASGSASALRFSKRAGIWAAAPMAVPNVRDLPSGGGNVLVRRGPEWQTAQMAAPRRSVR
jgi:membrane protein YdbS with pleckstrin-like domain